MYFKEAKRMFKISLPQIEQIILQKNYINLRKIY